MFFCELCESTPFTGTLAQSLAQCPHSSKVLNSVGLFNQVCLSKSVLFSGNYV